MDFRERLSTPIGWWAVGMFFAVSFVTAVGFYAGPRTALAAGALTAAAVAAALLWYGRPVVEVAADGLHADRALLDWKDCGTVVVHDRASCRHRLGPGADPSAWLLFRGYIPGAVEIEIADPADPHPYWLISSRRPAELAAAIEGCRDRLPQ